MNRQQIIEVALQCLNRHDHKNNASIEEKENCGACALAGYGGTPQNRVNYAGWARIYIQAGKAITPKLYYAFLAELASSNRGYADALKEDIRQFGINIVGKDKYNFKAAIQEVLEIWE